MVTRINGFSGSGMDIDTIVKNMMVAKRVPLDKTEQNKQTLQWQRDSYREINSKLIDFRTNKIANKYNLSSALGAQTAVVSGNTGAVKATAGANSNGVEMTVSVTQLATASKSTGNELGTGLKTTQSLADFKAAAVNKENGNTAAKAADYANDTFSITINGETIKDITSGTSLATVISKINGNTKMGVMASFDEVTGKLSIASKTMGPTGKVEIKAADNSLLEDIFSRPNGSPSTFEDRMKQVDGVKAKFTINGQAMPESDTNSVTYNGVQLDFLNTTNASGTDQPFTIKTQTDPQKSFDTVKAFIDDYNSLVALFNDKVSEEKYRDFPPLTAAQREVMNESDIKAWEEKAKSGLLKNDPILKSALTEMRAVIADKLGPLSDLGITTGQYYEGGKLYLDENKFKKAIQSNPQLALETFQGIGDGTSTSIFTKLTKTVNTALDKLVERAGTSKYDGSLTSTFKTESVMGRQLKEYNNRISLLTSQLSDTENRYYKQFTAMEKAMSKYQSQLSQLTGSSA